jgi:hypothetical protein
MTDWAEELLNPKRTKEPEIAASSDSGTDWAEVLLNTPKDVASDFQPTGDTSAITGKPVMEFKGQGGPGASFLANFKASWVNDPTVKAAIYANDRFPHLDPAERKKRYAVKNGEVFYLDDDGKWRSETPDMFGNKLKTFMQEFPGSPALSAVMSGAGELVGGIPGGMAGAAGAEAIRQAVAEHVFGENLTPAERAVGYGGQVAAAGAGSVVGRLGGKGANAALASRGGKIARIGLPDLQNINMPAVSARRAAGLRYGIDAPVAATAKSPHLQFAYNRLADLPETSTMIAEDRRRLANEVVDGVYQFLDELSAARVAGPPDITGKPALRFGQTPPSASEAGERLTQGAQSVIERQTNLRANKAKPYYERAYLTPVDDATAGDLLSDPVVSEAVKYVRSKPIYQKELGYGEEVANDLKLYDLAKRRIDDQIEVAKRAGEKNEARLLLDSKNLLVNKLDAISPDYKNARKIFGDYSLELERTGKKTTLNDIANLEGDQVLGSFKRMFAPGKNAPERVRVQRELIQREDPQAWNDGLRMYMQDLFEQYKAPRGGEANPAGWFSQMTTGRQSQAKILEAAMEPWQYQNLVQLNELMHEISNLYRSQSTTADKIWFDKLLAGVGGKAKTFFEWLQPREKAARWAEDRYTAMNAKLITEAIFDPNVSIQLRRIRQIPKGTLKYFEAAATALSTAGAEVKNELPYQVVSPRKWQGQGKPAQ